MAASAEEENNLDQIKINCLIDENMRSWTSVREQLMTHFMENKNAYYTYISSLLNTYIYSNTPAMRAVEGLFDTPKYNEALLGAVHMNEPHQLLYSRIGHDMYFTLPNKETKTLCTISCDDETIYITFVGKQILWKL
jgi:hypothetical protein